MQKKLKLKIYAGLALFLFLTVCTGFYNVYKPLAKGISFEGEFRSCSSLKFLSDLTWTEKGAFKTQHKIFDEILANISSAKKIIIMDMFLFNDFKGNSSIEGRKISKEITDALIQKKTENRDICIIVITDPINTVYNGLKNPVFTKLKTHNISVFFTDLNRLRDSNPLYSSIWRVFIKPFGTNPGDSIKNPFGRGRVSVKSILKLLNFKANHRKILISDKNNSLTAVVSSANPHDASSMHWNAGVAFSGKAVFDLLKTEKAVVEISDGTFPEFSKLMQKEPVEKSKNKIKIITENKILENILSQINSCGKNDKIDIVMFYFSHRKIIRALKKASEKGVSIRILLDANKDAFGRQKNGIPNRVTAAELRKSGIKIKWAATNGEQLHTKMLLVRKAGDQNILIIGSANYTRRNLNDFNLETDVMTAGSLLTPFFQDSLNYVNLLWNNSLERVFSLEYEKYSENSNLKKTLYFLMEYTGLCTF